MNNGWFYFLKPYKNNTLSVFLVFREIKFSPWRLYTIGECINPTFLVTLYHKIWILVPYLCISNISLQERITHLNIKLNTVFFRNTFIYALSFFLVLHQKLNVINKYHDLSRICYSVICSISPFLSLRHLILIPI